MEESYKWMEAFDECQACGASAGWCICGGDFHDEDVEAGYEDYWEDEE